MPQPVIEIKDLSINFRSGETIIPAVKDIHLSVQPGKLLAVVGESGSGKTVMALSILRLLPQEPAQQTSGEILFSKPGLHTIDINKTNKREIRNIRGMEISMIFQEPMTSLNPLMTCGAQVMEAINIHTGMTNEQAKKKTITLFQKVDLPDPGSVYNKFPHQLSGGQKQRVMIAMAMSCEPSLLIADEPTTALDVTVQKKILTLIKDLQHEQGMAVIFITHDLNLVAQIADEIVVMRKGEIVEQGTVTSIFKNPQHPYTKALLACRPNHQSKGKRLPLISDFLNADKENSKPVRIKKNEKISDPSPKIIVDIKNLVVNFPLKKNIFGKVTKEFTAIDDISFSVIKGETLGVVGESGCGKTTLGRSLVRLVVPTSGHIYYGSQDIAYMNEDELKNMRQSMQIIFQDPYGSLNPRITIGKAIEEPLHVHHLMKDADERRERVLDLLKKVDLNAENFHRYPHQFSGGQRQRICIARALALNPEFIICDESVSALDVSVQAQVLNLITDLKNDLGFTCLFISHDLNVVRYISDRIMVMRKGKIIEIGDADKIYFNPAEPYTAELINSIPKGIS